jgi:phosphatidylinositol alpha-1,6-mannosyltransferase
MTMNGRHWFLGASRLGAGHGGIARVARLTAKTLIEEGAALTMTSLHDGAPVDIGGRQSMVACNNRILYAAQCHKSVFTCDHFLYDAVGMARAHPRLPGLRKPYGVWIHGVEVWDSLHAARARALRAADFVLVNSRFTLDKFQELHWPLENAHVCRLATEDDELPQTVPHFGGPPTALLIGRSDKDNFRKGHKEVIGSWAAVIRAIPDAELLIAGGGDGLDLLRETVARSPARERIKVLGFVPEEEMPMLWDRAQLFVQPSWKEGFGLVYIEAMRHGLPVIASVHDAGQEVNVDNKTGFNIDMNKPEQLAERIIDLLRDPDKAREMGHSGQERWRKNFRFGAFRKRLSNILETKTGR